MQFSLKWLMAFALFASLAISAWATSRSAQTDREKAMKLKAEMKLLSESIGDFERKELHFSRFAKANENRVEEFAIAVENAKQKLASHGHLEITNPELFSICEVPCLPEKDIKDWRWRLYVPEEAPVELALDFIRQERSSKDLSSKNESRGLEEATLFFPSTPLRVDMPTGEFNLRFQWIGSLQGSKELSILIDEAEVCRYQFRAETNGYSTSGQSFKKQVDRDPTKPLKLFSFRPSASDSEFAERVSARILPKQGVADEE